MNNFATTEAEIVEMSMRLAGVGKQVGMTEADIMALATAMSSVGIEAEAGGTAMTTVIKKMQNAVSNGGKDLQNFAKAAGMSAQEFAKAFQEDPVKALDAFIKNLAKSSAEGENLNTILDSVGIKGIREADTVLRLAGASEILADAVGLASDAWEENTALSDEAEQRYNTLASQLSMLKNTVIDAAISLGTALMPYIRQANDILKSLIERFNSLPESMKSSIAIFGALASAAALLVGPLLLMVGFLPNVASGFGALAKVITGLLNPVSLTVLAIGGIAAALYLAYQRVEQFRDTVNTAWEWIKNTTLTAFESVKESVLSAINAVAVFVQEKLDTIVQFWHENGEQIKQAASNVWNFIKNVIETVMPVIESIIKTVWKGVQFVVKAVWENIKGVINGALNIILGLIKTFSAIFTGDWNGVWEGVKQILKGAVEFVWNFVQLMFWGRLLKGLTAFATSFRSMFTSLWSAIQGIFTGAINTIKNLVTGGFNAMYNVANTSMVTLRTAITAVWDAIKTIFSTVINGIKSTVQGGFSDVVNMIRNAMSSALSAVKSTLSSMINAVRSAVSSFFNLGKDLIRGLIDGIKSMSAAAINAITGVVDGVINKAKSLLGIASPSKLFSKFGKWVGQGFADGIIGMTNTVGRASEQLAKSAIPKISNISLAYNVPSGLHASLASAVSGTVDVNTRDEMLASAIASLERKLTNLTIVMNEREVARATTNEIDRELGRKQANPARRAFL